MSIVGLELSRQTGRLDVAAAGARGIWRERSGLLLRLTDASGRVGRGEASPLPGYSPDRVDACEAALRALKPSTLAELGPDPAGLVARLARASSVISPALPAARHALETALLDLEAQRQGEPIWALLRRACPAARGVPSLLALAQVLDADGDDALLETATAALGRGIRTLKLKLGRRPFEQEHALLTRLRREVGPAIELRMDVNGAWIGAASHLERLAELRPELVEEGVPAPRLAELATSPVALAFDESLQDGAALDRIARSLGRARVAALVLKPMALGGVARCLELASWARARDIDVIVSHLYDGPVALAAAAHLALAVGSPERAAGLAPHSGLSAWPRLEVPFVTAAHVLCDATPGLGIAA